MPEQIVLSTRLLPLTSVRGTQPRVCHFSEKSVPIALDASSGNIQWKHSIGPLPGIGVSPVIDPNGWVSVGSMEEYLYSVLPEGSQGWRWGSWATWK